MEDLFSRYVFPVFPKILVGNYFPHVQCPFPNLHIENSE